MPRESLDIIHPLSLPGLRRGAADTTAQSDTDASGLALKRPDYQLLAIEKVESDPIEPGQGMEHQGRQVGRIGHLIGFAMHQSARLLQQLGILLGLAAAQT